MRGFNAFIVVSLVEEEVVTIPASADVLIGCSDRFRASLDGGFYEAQTKTVRVELCSWEEMEMLCELVRRAHTSPDDYLVGIGKKDPVWVGKLLLTADKFLFEKCVKQCLRNLDRVLDCRNSLKTAVSILHIIPDELFDVDAGGGVGQLQYVVFGHLANQCFGDHIRHAFMVNLDKTLVSLNDADDIWATRLHPTLLSLPPQWVKRLVDEAMDTLPTTNDIYTMVCCYLVQSAHCKDMNQDEKAAAFHYMMVSVFERCEGSGLTPWYAGYVVSTCPYIEHLSVKSMRGLLKGFTGFLACEIYVDVTLKPEDVTPLRYYPLGIFLGVPLFLCAEAGTQMPYAFQLVGLLPGTADVAYHFVKVFVKKNYNDREEYRPVYITLYEQGLKHGIFRSNMVRVPELNRALGMTNALQRNSRLKFLLTSHG